MKNPDYHQPIMPYFIVKNAKGFITFLSHVFDVTIKLEVPRNEESIMHAELTIEKGTIMVADATDDYPASANSLFILSANAISFYEKAISYGSTSLQTPEQRDYGFSAGFKDEWNNIWWLTVPEEK